MTADPFGTATLRERALAMWTAAPVRFREDANAEEELVLGGYRDRLVVELAQNAADAAVRAGVRGRLLLRVDELDGKAVLIAANTGAPLDAEGVLALATLRASAKREATAGAGSGSWSDPRSGADAGPSGVPVATVGRFGVGFAAVLAVTDEPVIVSRHGGVRFSAGDTRDLVTAAAAGVPGLADELARRDGHVPVLRLPLPAEGTPPDGYDTAVLLPLRDAAAEDLALRLLAEVGDPLLLALPGLAEVTVVVPGRPARTVAEVEARWDVLRRGGELAAEVLAGRTTEERARRAWSVTWALPRAGVDVRLPGVVHAPTPSDEPLPWPALLVATFPLDSSRRHVAPGAATDVLVRHAAQAYAQLLARCAAGGQEIWPLVPIGLASGALDEALRAQLLRLLPDVPLLPDPAADPAYDDLTYDDLTYDDLTYDDLTYDELAGDGPAGDGPAGDGPAGDGPALDRWTPDHRLGAEPVTVTGPGRRGPALLRPRDALALEPPAGADPRVVAVLAGRLAGLVVAPRGSTAVLRALGVRTITLADAVEQLPAPDDPPGWRTVYAALAVLAEDPLAREALAALPVPLADGRVVRGVRGLLLPSGPAPVGAALGRLGLRTVHPDAVDPLLERLGAIAVDARAALELAPVRELVAACADGDAEDDPVLVEAVLELVAAAVAAGELAPGDLPWLADLWLADQGGEASPAGSLALPGSAGAQLLDPDEVGLVSTDLLDRWGPAVLAAVGVLDGPALLHAEDVPLDPAEPRDLDGWDDWADAALDAVPFEPLEATVVELDAVLDLDLVRDDAWPLLLRALAADPRLRSAVTTPARIRAQGSTDAGQPTSIAVDVPPYTAWWLAQRLAGGRSWADPQAEPGLAVLLPPAPALLAGLDPQLRRALGSVVSAADLDARAVQALVDGLADPDAELDAATVLAVWSSLAGLADAADVEPPELARVLDGDGSRVVAADRAVVVDEPALLQRRDLGLPVLAVSREAGTALARLLDLPLAADLVQGRVDEDQDPGLVTPVPAAARALVPAAPATWCEHDRLVVDGVDVQWWVEPAGPGGDPDGGGDSPRVHACTLDGLAAGLAWAGSAWHRRGSVAEALVDPSALAGLLAQEAFAPVVDGARRPIGRPAGTYR